MLKKMMMVVVLGLVFMIVGGLVSGESGVKGFEVTVIQQGEEISDVIERVNGLEVGSFEDSFVDEVREFNLMSDTCLEEGCEVSIPIMER